MRETARRPTILGRAVALIFGLSIAITSACVSEDRGASAGVIPPSCDAYCTQIQKNCGAPMDQYKDRDECLKVCGMLDLGASTDGDVNSIACRQRKATTAKTLADCVAAGPFGGGVCGGDRCQPFCTIVAANCFGDDVPDPPYNTDPAQCREQCGDAFRFEPNEGEGLHVKGSNTLNCRAYHLILSIGSKIPHCHHVDVASPVCVN